MIDEDDDESDVVEADEAEDIASLSSGAHQCTAEADDAGMRLDRFLAGRLSGISRARLQSLIRDGHVEGPGGAVLNPGAKVRPSQTFRIEIPEPEPAAPEAETLPLTVVYEDEHLIVIDKPAGLVVHPAAGHARGTLVNALIAHCGESLSGIGGVRRPGIVHRLDKDTSGLLVVAKSDAAHRGLAEQFAAHGADGRLVRTYEAFVWGVPHRNSGVIEANLARSRTHRTRMTVTRSEQSRHAVTHFETIETFADAKGAPLGARMRLHLETGRTHQIRVHLAHIGHPVMGDEVYGSGFKSSTSRLSEKAAEALTDLRRQALHAQELGFEHPITHHPLHFTSPRPADIERLYNALNPGTIEGSPPPRAKVKSKVSKR